MVKGGLNDGFIEELKTKCDIVSTISKYLTLQKKGKTYWACCPFHYEKTPSFAVNESDQYYHCYGCGESGDVIKFIEKYESLSFMESVKLLCDSCGLKIPEFEQNLKDLEILKNKEKVLRALNLSMNYYKQNLKDLNKSQLAHNYLNFRGLNSEIVDYFNIGYSIDWNSLVNYLLKEGISLETMKQAGLIDFNEYNKPYDFYGTRLMFPIQNVFGDCIGFTARTLESDAKFAKYKNSPQTIVFDKSKTIYNLHTIKALKKEQKINYIIICEGTIDVIAMFKAGFKNTVACMGTAITNFHAHELKRFTDKILLCLDGDSAGQNAMYKAIDVLSLEGLEVKVVKLKDNLDPDEYLKKFGADDLKNCLDTAIDAFEYKLKSLAEKFNLNDSYQKNKYTSQALEIINSLENSYEKEIYLKVLSNITNLSLDILRRDLFKDIEISNKKIEAYNDKILNLPFRMDGITKATMFVLSSIVHKKKYVDIKNLEFLSFQNPSYQKLFEFVKSCFINNKVYTISTLFDYFDVENNKDINDIIGYDFSMFCGNEQQYYEDCLAKLKQINLNKYKEDLLNQFKTEKDLDKRKQIAEDLNKIAKELKLKRDK